MGRADLGEGVPFERREAALPAMILGEAVPESATGGALRMTIAKTLEDLGLDRGVVDLCQRPSPDLVARSQIQLRKLTVGRRAFITWTSAHASIF